MGFVNYLRCLAEDLHVLSGHNKYAAALSMAADQIESIQRKDAPATVLAYQTSGHSRPCGQTIGSNGAGDFAMLIYGNPEKAQKHAARHLKMLEDSGHKVEKSILVLNEEGYTGRSITTVHWYNNQHYVEK